MQDWLLGSMCSNPMPYKLCAPTRFAPHHCTLAVPAIQWTELPLPCTFLRRRTVQEQRRVQLAASEQQWVRQQQLQGNWRLHFTSLERVMGPWSALSVAQQSAWFSDGLHMTPEGYVVVGDAITDAVAPVLQLCQAMARTPLGHATAAGKEQWPQGC